MSLYARLRAGLLRCLTRLPILPRVLHPFPSASVEPTLLVIVEGPHGVQFLKRISAMLHVAEPRLPDLGAMERRGELIFVPLGGADLKLWTHRLARLAKPEFHLYDREVPPQTELRQQMAEIVNLRPGCRAALTSKRNLENYLHPAAIREVSGIELQFGDDDLVADLIARRVYAQQNPTTAWEDLPRQTRTRRRNRVKHWLNTTAADRMSPERLAERDPAGEVRSWLRTMAAQAASR